MYYRLEPGRGAAHYAVVLAGPVRFVPGTKPRSAFPDTSRTTHAHAHATAVSYIKMTLFSNRKHQETGYMRAQAALRLSGPNWPRRGILLSLPHGDS